MDLDGFIKLNDAQRADATARADIAGKFASADSTLADIPDKLAKADLTEAQAVNQQYKNLALWLGIRWDFEAHDHLQRTIIHELEKARAIENEQKRLKLALLHIPTLMSGSPSLTGAQQGWLGFAFLRDHVPVEITIKAAETAPPDGIYAESSWAHPEHALPAMPEHDPGSLLAWAARHNCYPKWASPAYVFIGSYLEALSTGAAAKAAEIQSQLEAAQKAALALEQQDWDRLKTPAGK